MEKLYGVVKKLDKLNLDKNEKEKVFSFFKNVKRKRLTKDEFDDAMLYIKRLNIPTNNKIELMEILKDYGRNNLRVKKDRINELYREIYFQRRKTAGREIREFYDDLTENFFYLVYGLGFNGDYYANEEVFSEIALSNLKKNVSKKEKNYQHISMKKTLELAKEGIGAISEEYLELFNEYYVNADDKLFFTPKSNPTFVTPFGEISANESSYDSRGFINIAIEHNISDVFTLIHEFLHYTNNFDSSRRHSSMYFTETISHFAEIYTSSVLKEKHPEYKDDIEAYIRDRFDDVLFCVISNKITGMFVRTIENGRSIGRKDLFESLSTVRSLSNKLVKKEDFEICLTALSDQFCDEISVSPSYSKAFVLSGTIYELCKKNGIDFFTFVNELLPFSYRCEIYGYLDILKDFKTNEQKLDKEIALSTIVEIFKEFFDLLVLEDDEDKYSYFEDYILDDEIIYHLISTDYSNKITVIDFDKVEKSYKKLMKDLWRQ